MHTIFSVGIIGPTQLIRDFNIVWLLTVLCIMVGKSLAFAFFTNNYLFYIYIALTQTIFIISYFFLRYYFDPGFDFFELFTKGIFRLIVGNKTYDYITQEYD